MPIQNTQFTTVTCDQCAKTATFEVTPNGVENKVIEENPWLKTNLVIQTGDKRVFSICSPLCLVEAATALKFDPVEPKQIAPVVGGGTAAIAAAAAAERRKQLADKNIREGNPTEVRLS